MHELTIKNVQVVPGDGEPAVTAAAVVLDGDGVVRAIEPAPESASQADAPGELLLVPAAVDLHLDVISVRRRPRASVELDLADVVAALDAECAGAGIDTVCVAARFEESPAKGIRRDDAVRLCELIEDLADRLACGWHVHGRVEMTDAGAVDAVAAALDRTTRLRLLSVMEHSAERTRFATADEHRAFYAADWGLPAEEVDRLMAAQLTSRDEVTGRREAVAELARSRGVVLASHDDRTPEQIEEAHKLGATVAEFPLTLAAARRARELGMRTVLGAPNAVRGRSTAPGNLLAADAVAEGVCDVLCSDYLPSALLQAPLRLAARGVAPLSQLVDLVAAAPARTLGLTPPRMQVGHPLDAALVRRVGELYLPVATWRRGRLVQRRNGGQVLG